jgi:modulator of drug activity B
MSTSTAASGPFVVHLIDAHLNYPGWSEGGLNRTMVEVATAHLRQLGHTVTSTRVEESYDADHEVQRYLDADLVILQTPINWFNPPWIYKRYVDEVFNAGLRSKSLLDNDGRTRSDPQRQYGTGGHMQGRGFFVSATWTAPTQMFDDREGALLRGKTVSDLLLGVSANYRFVGFTVLEHYGLYDIFHGTTLPEDLRAYPAHLDRQLARLTPAPLAC